MKKLTINIVLVMITVLMITACKKEFLDLTPKGSRVARTVDDYNLLMNGTLFYEYNDGLPAQVLGDDVSAEKTYIQNATPQIQRAFAYRDILADRTETYNEFQRLLENIYTCNKVINEIDEAEQGNLQQKNVLKGEAMATRALNNFYFISLYAEPYSAATAGAAPGFPIILTANISVTTFKRGSVQQVYDQIIADLQMGINLLPVNNGSKSRMSRSAAKAILGKVYLFMGKYAESLAQFNGSFEDNEASANPADLYNYNMTLAPAGSFLPVGFFGPTYPGNNRTDQKESLLHKTTNGGNAYGSGFGSTGLIISEETMDLFQPSDLRLTLYSRSHNDGSSIPYLTRPRYRKYALQYVNNGFVYADLLLLRAEVRCRTGNLQGAKDDVENLRKHRMPENDAAIPASIANSQSELIRFIIEERKREFAGEGLRWLDMRRLSTDPLFSPSTYNHIIYGPDGTIAETYALRKERLTLRFPEDLMAANPGMTNNP